MTVQTIPSIEEMTPVQKVELMEALWKSMSKNPESIESPEWHGRVLAEREEALKNGTDRFISLEEAEARIREKTR
jgi:Putative addiction module component